MNLDPLYLFRYWYTTEWQKRVAQHIHGFVKMRCDPGLAELGRLAVAGHRAAAKLPTLKDPSPEELDLLHRQIAEGKIASEQIISFVDYFTLSRNPINPEDWQPPQSHPSRRLYCDIKADERQAYLTDLINQVQRHTRCSSYCLRERPPLDHTASKSASTNEKDVQGKQFQKKKGSDDKDEEDKKIDKDKEGDDVCYYCRFGFPKPTPNKSYLTIEEEDTYMFGKIAIVRVVLARNDSLLAETMEVLSLGMLSLYFPHFRNP